jgi:hypothetical protein
MKNGKIIRFVLTVMAVITMVAVTQAEELVDFDGIAGNKGIIKLLDSDYIPMSSENNVYCKKLIFDPKLLYKKCPNSGKIKFSPGKGFSICCSYLMYNPNPKVINNVSNKDLDLYLKSSFYKIITTYNFKKILDKLHLNINLKSKKMISECDGLIKLFFKYYE